MRNVYLYITILAITILPLNTIAQNKDSLDLTDIVNKLIDQSKPRIENKESDYYKAHTSVFPAVGYTLQSGLAGILSSNILFKLHQDSITNKSFLLTNITYTQYQQFILPLETYLWTKNNNYNISTDWRYMKYPQYTYGIGGNTSPYNGYHIDYSLVRLHQTLLRKIVPRLYGGIGFNFDHYWNIYEVDIDPKTPTDFKNYGLNSTASASGPTFNILYDNRDNPINATIGSYAKLVYIKYLTALGSDKNWQSLAIDLRHYFKLLPNSKNTLALWAYAWSATYGSAPYVMLPSTGWDPFNNTGRGYIQGRFRGNNLLYTEAEYRFGITNNQLIGGVIYSNLQTVSESNTNKFAYIKPAVGFGLRLKLNKYSKTNIAIDYAFGADGSNGLWVNLGEVF